MREAIENTTMCRSKLLEKIGRKLELQIRESNNTISGNEKIEFRILLREIQLLDANLTDYEKLTRDLPFTLMRFSDASEVFIQQSTGVDTAYRIWVPQHIAV